MVRAIGAVTDPALLAELESGPALKLVTDPTVLSRLDSGPALKEVTDPLVLARLDGDSPPPFTPGTGGVAEALSEPSEIPDAVKELSGVVGSGLSGGARAASELVLFPLRAIGEIAAASAGRTGAFEGFPGAEGSAGTDKAAQEWFSRAFQGGIERGKSVLLGDSEAAKRVEEGVSLPFDPISEVARQAGSMAESATGDPLIGKLAEYGALLGVFRAIHKGPEIYRGRTEIVEGITSRLNSLKNEIGSSVTSRRMPFAEKDAAGQVEEILAAGQAEAGRRGVIPPAEEPLPTTAQPGVDNRMGAEPTETPPTESQEIPSTPPLSPVERRQKPYEGPRERREDLGLRKKISEMSPEERGQALMYDELTGLKSRRAFDEEADRQPVKVALDVHGLKWVNDNVGHEAGDQLLRAVADAIHEGHGEGYRMGGSSDELVIMADSPEAAEASIRKVKHALSESVIEATLPDGSKTYYKGITLSNGTGGSIDEAFQALNADKQAAIGRGERSAERGGRPGKLAEIPAEGEQAAGAPAEAEEVIAPSPGSLPVSPPGDRWTADRGAIPGEPAFFLDQDTDGNSSAVIIEHENFPNKPFEVFVDDAGVDKPLGRFASIKEAAQEAEKMVDRFTKEEPQPPRPATLEIPAEVGRRKTTEKTASETPAEVVDEATRAATEQGIPLKEQKRYVLDAIAETKKKALPLAEMSQRQRRALERWDMEESGSAAERIAIRSGAVVEIHIPGDGTFHVVNSLEALTEFEKRVKSLFPSGAAKTSKNRYPTVSKGGRMPRAGTLPNGVKVEGGGWTTNGQLLLKGELPVKPDQGARTIPQEEIRSLLLNIAKKKGKAVEPSAFIALGEDLDFAISDQPIAKVEGTTVNAVRFKTPSGEIYIDQDYYVYVKEHFPDAKFHFAGPEDPVLITSKGESVGALAPLKARTWRGLANVRFPGEKPPAAEETRQAAAPESEPSLAFAPEKGFRRTPEAAEEAASGPVRRSDIVNFLRDKFDIPIRYGKVAAGAMKGVLGIFKVKPEVIRAKFANDIETISHEIGHALHKFLFPKARDRKGLTGKPFETFSDELLPLATRPRPGADPLPEGFAEFVRRYVVNEKDAKERAPKFFSWFEAELSERAPEAREILLQVRSDYERWLKQPAAARILGQISIGERTRRPASFDSLYTMMLDELHPLKKITEAMAGTEKLLAPDDPYKLARLMAGWQGKVDAFLEHQPFGFKDYAPLEGTKSLLEILAPMRVQLDDLRVFLVAKRAVEKAAQGVETGILVEDANRVIADAGGKYDAAAAELQAYQDAVLRYAVAGGLISRKQYVLMKRMNQDYVPFYRVMEGEGAKGTGKGLEARSPVKRMKGSHRDIVDPLESIVKNTYAIINATEKNAVGQALVNIPKKREGLGKYVEKIPADRIPVPIYEKEILDILRRYGKWTESRQFVETGKKVRETIREEGAADGTIRDVPPGSRGDRLLEDRAREALTSRGWSPAEAEQILKRIRGAKTDEARNRIIERTVEKTVVLSTVRELGVEIPEGLTRVFRPSPFAPKGNVLTVVEKGEPAYYEVHEDIYRTFQALDKETANALIRVLAIPSRLLRAGATLSPEFIGRNPIRDQFTAFVYSKYGFVPGVDLLRGISHMLKGSEVYWDWKRSGGEHAALVSMDREYLQKNLADLLKEKTGKEIAKTIVRHPIDSLRALSELMEQGTRIGEFAKGLAKEGKGKAAIQEAGFASREVTLDFQRGGAKTKAVNMLVAFWNAQVQGMDKMVREFQERPMTATAKAVAAITVPSVLLTIANHDDSRWKEIPRWQKDLFWIVLTDKHIWRIPKPFELGILFGTVPERFVEYGLDRNPHAFDQLLDTIVTGAAPGYIPTVMNPFIENWSNKSTFTGRPLVSRSRENMLPAYQYRPYTSEVAKQVGRLLGKLPVVGETGSASPAKIENLIRGWTGGLGMHALRAADNALRTMGLAPGRVDPSATMSDIPFIKGFAVRYPSSDAESIQRFYDRYGRASRVTATARQLISEGEEGEATGLISARDMARLDSVKDALNNAHALIEAVYANPEIDPEEKRLLIDQTYLDMIAIAEAGNTVLEGLEGPEEDGK